MSLNRHSQCPVVGKFVVSVFMIGHRAKPTCSSGIIRWSFLPSSNNCSGNNVPDKVYLTPSQVRRRSGGITSMTLYRWLRQKKMGFPKPVYFNRLRYWRLSDLEAWENSKSADEEAEEEPPDRRFLRRPNPRRIPFYDRNRRLIAHRIEHRSSVRKVATLNGLDALLEDYPFEIVPFSLC